MATRKSVTTKPLSKKVFREKTTVKAELEKALKNKEKITHGTIARAVGISVHRVKKYCKNHGIDIENYNQKTLDNPLPVEKKTMKPKKRVVKLDDPVKNKIALGEPQAIKVNLD
jgi:hypothetical protein